MKKRLFTHEWLRTRGVLGVIAAGAFALWAAGMILGAIGILPPIAIAACVIACILILPATSLYLAVDYWRSAYGRRGYLTHTLPVRGGTQYWVRLGYACLVLLGAWILTALLAVGAILLFTAGEWGTWSQLGTMIGEAMAELGATEYLLIAGWIVIILLGTYASQIQFYFAGSFGSESLLNRFGGAGPVIAYVVLYLAQQVLSFLSLLIPLAITADPVTGMPRLTTSGYYDMLFGAGEQMLMPLGTVVVSVVVTLALLWRTWVSWERKVALR